MELTSGERRYSRYKVADVWAAAYQQQDALGIVLHDSTRTANSVHLTRVSTNATSKAVILARASDWYAFSLNCRWEPPHGIEMVVCGTHDSCVPVPVLALDTLRWYEPEQMRRESLAPLSFDEKGIVNDQFDQERRSLYGHNMLIGALMCGREDAVDRLAHMRESTRLRIEAKLKRLHQRRSGKPLDVGLPKKKKG